MTINGLSPGTYRAEADDSGIINDHSHDIEFHTRAFPSHVFDYTLCIDRPSLCPHIGLGSSGFETSIHINSPNQETRPENIAVRYLIRAIS